MDFKTLRKAHESRQMVNRFEQLLDQGLKPKQAIKQLMAEFLYSYQATLKKVQPRIFLRRRQRKAYEEKTLLPRREKLAKARNKPGRPKSKKPPEPTLF